MPRRLATAAKGWRDAMRAKEHNIELANRTMFGTVMWHLVLDTGKSAYIHHDNDSTTRFSHAKLSTASAITCKPTWESSSVLPVAVLTVAVPTNIHSRVFCAVQPFARYPPAPFRSATACALDPTPRILQTLQITQPMDHPTHPPSHPKAPSSYPHWLSHHRDPSTRG